MTEDSDLTPRMARLMSAIWHDVGVQHCASRSKDYQLFDSAIFFLNSLDRISAPNYIPTFDDMLRSRIKTTGIVEMQFNFKVYQRVLIMWLVNIYFPNKTRLRGYIKIKRLFDIFLGTSISNYWCWGPKIRKKKMDSLLWWCNGSYLCCSLIWLPSLPGRRPRN